MRIAVLSLLPVLLTFTEPCIAVRQGTATADLFIKRYTQSGDFGRLALWHEAAAECLRRISVPMNEIAHDYYVRHGPKTWAVRAKKEAEEIQDQYQSHCMRAEIAWQKSGTPKSELAAEYENIEKFIARWLPRYPDRFYEFGIYPTFFRKQRELAEQDGDYLKVLHLEADAAAMCAAQYAQIPVAYGLTNYQKHRDAYRRHAVLLRHLARQNPKALPPEIDNGRRILDSLAIQTLSTQQKSDAILHIAKSDARVKAALAGQRGVHAYPSFQGFAWIVSFSNHGHGNIVTAIIDEKTAEVLDVF
jgi:hypothetical protein